MVEKLLWSCPDIGKIFIIVRSKKGKSVEDRVTELTNSPAFDRIRSHHPDRLEKIIALEGDITMENLGLSDDDIKRIHNEVNVIFHSAASVKFEDILKDAVNNNTLPTKRMILMAKHVKHLDVI